MGNLVYEAITGKEMSGNRGRPTWMPTLGAYVMGTYHPAGFLRGNSQLILDICKDLQKIPMIIGTPDGEWCGWPADGSVSNVRYTVVESAEEAQAVLDGLPRGEDSLVSIDIETNYGEEEIDIFNEEITCLSVCWDHDYTAVIPACYLDDIDWPSGVRWAFQNGMFDVNKLRQRYGVKLAIHEDSLLQSYSLDERGGVHKLEITSGEYCGADHYKEQFRYNKRRGVATNSLLYEYNAKDTAYTRRLVPCFENLQRKDNVYQLYKDLFIPLANVFADISYQGVKVDQDKIAELALEWLPRWLASEEQLVSMANEYGWPGRINLNSPAQLIKLLFGVLSLRMPNRYARQKPSTKVEVLELMDHPFIDALLDFRQLDHMVTNYLIGIKDQIKLDGRVHPAVLIHGSRTGRPSYRNPPVQTIPQPYSVGAELSRIKEIFVPDDEQSILLEADYKQIEVFLAAYLSQDPIMQADLESGDFHSSTAADVIARMERDAFLQGLRGKDPLRIKQRFQAKKVTFGNFYRQGADSLARKRVADCTYAEASSMLIRWRARYRIYEEWADSIMRSATERGELVTVTGRKRRFRVVYGDDSAHILRQSVNFPIQGSANDYILTSLLELYEPLSAFGARVLLSVHDSMLFCVPLVALADCAQYIKCVMEKPRFPGWPSIEVELKIGNNWGSMVSYDKT